MLLQILPACPSDGAGQPEQTNEGIQKKLTLGECKHMREIHSSAGGVDRFNLHWLGSGGPHNREP